MMVKVGDRVQIDEDTSAYYGQCGVVSDSQRFGAYPYKVRFEDGGWSIFTEKDLTVLSTEEETSMKFKVGDKVKVSNSWDGHNGEIGEINEYEKGYEFEYCVTFDGEYEESFRETELELVSEKDNYPTLKQEYKELLEIQKELTTLEESMMRTVRHTRTEIARNYEELAELESKILDAAKQ